MIIESCGPSGPGVARRRGVPPPGGGSTVGSPAAVGMKGLWLGPDDKILSVTPLWPRPNRSLFFFCSYVALVVGLLAVVSAPADEARQLTVGILRQAQIQAFNQISSSYDFWQWLQASWLSNSSLDMTIEYLNPEFRLSFPASGAKSFSLKEGAFSC